MPRLQVLSCPSCGASLSIEEGEAAAQCEFCGNTVIVPEELRRPSPGPAPAPPPSANIRLGGIPFLDQLPRLREMGDLVRSGRRTEAALLYRQLFGTSEADARAAVDLMAAGQPVTVQHLSTGFGGSTDDSGIFRFDRMGMPQIQVSTMGSSPPPAISGTPISGGYAGTPMAGSYTGTPVVIRSGGGNRLAGCIIALVVLSVVGSLAIGLLASVGGLLPLLAIPGLTDILPDDVQEVVADVTNQYPRVELRFGGTGTGSGVFTDARHVGVDGDGNIYVAEYTGGRVQVFGPDGRYVTQWTPESENDIYLTGFAVGNQGEVYLIYGSDLFQYDGQTGDLIRQLEYPDDWGFSDVAALPGGGVAATWYKNRDDLIIYDEDGEVALAVQEAISGITGDLEPTVKVAVDGRGDIFLAGSFAEAVFHYSADGEYQNRFGGAGDEAGQFRAIGDVAIDQQGRIYVSDIRGIQVFDNDGRFVETIDPPEVSYVYGMAFDNQNRLYVVSNDTVLKYQLTADE